MTHSLPTRRSSDLGLNFESEITEIIQPNPKFIVEHNYALGVLEELKRQDFKVIPILNTDNVIIDILNFRTRSTIIPVDAVSMAGGEGKRLRPLTAQTPKPLLPVGGKPIIEYNIDRLSQV